MEEWLVRFENQCIRIVKVKLERIVLLVLVFWSKYNFKNVLC